MTDDRTARISERLRAALGAASVDVQDDSALHAGHPGARGGGGHFAVRVIAESFGGHSRLQRHQMVYQALGDMMRTEIHALSIHALTPSEIQQRIT